MKAEIIGFRICISMEKDQFLKLNEKDGLEVITMLEDFGAYNIEWDNFYGPHIFFTVGSKHEIEHIKKKIEKILGDTQ